MLDRPSLLKQLEEMPLLSFALFEELPNLHGLIRNPHHEQVELEVEKFAQAHDLIIDGFDQTKTMTGFLYPNASKERYLTINNLMAILFWIDDVFGDNQKLTEDQRQQLLVQWFSALKYVSKDINPNDLVTKALLDVAKEIFKTSSLTYYGRLLELFIQYLPENIALGKILGMTVSEYIEYRIRNSGMRPTIFLTQWANNNFLDYNEIEQLGLDTFINQLEKFVEIIGAFSNDLFSWPKEVLVDNLNANIIQVLMRSQGLSLEDAFKEGIKIVNYAIANFKEIKEVLLIRLSNPDISSELKLSIEKHIKNLEDIIIAAFEWQKFTDRYKDTQHHPFRELRTN